MKLLPLAGAALMAACLIATSAAAQFAAPFPRPQTPGPLDAAARQETVAAAAEALRQGYVYPETGEEAAAALEAALAAGDYDGLSRHWDFANALTDDLQAAAGDKHLRLAAPGVPMRAPPALLRPPPPPAEAGVARADILPDDIGYIELTAFPAPDAFGAVADRAMAGLADTRALIVDLRRHGGGSPAAETYFASYFIASDEPVEFTRIVWRNNGTETFRTQRYFHSQTPYSYAGKPVYLLVGPYTFSGAEALAYDMQALGLAIVVGETTRGGAHPGGSVTLGPNLAINIPTGRAENPVTEANWEGTGVTPDIETPADRALQTALAELGVEADETDIEALSEERVFTPSVPQGGPAVVRRPLPQ